MRLDLNQRSRESEVCHPSRQGHCSEGVQNKCVRCAMLICVYVYDCSGCSVANDLPGSGRRGQCPCDLFLIPGTMFHGP